MCSGSVRVIGNPTRCYPIICIERIKSGNTDDLYLAYINTYGHTSETVKLTTDVTIEDLSYPSTT